MSGRWVRWSSAPLLNPYPLRMATVAAPIASVAALRKTWIALLLATVMFPPAALASLPIAFGIAMTGFDFDDSSSLLANPWLLVPASVVLADLFTLGASWTLHGLRRFRVGWLLSTIISISISALILVDLASALVTS
jgi:hypothetical protein